MADLDIGKSWELHLEQNERHHVFSYRELASFLGNRLACRVSGGMSQLTGSVPARYPKNDLHRKKAQIPNLHPQQKRPQSGKKAWKSACKRSRSLRLRQG